MVGCYEISRKSAKCHTIHPIPINPVGALQSVNVLGYVNKSLNDPIAVRCSNCRIKRINFSLKGVQELLFNHRCILPLRILEGSLTCN